MQDAGTFCPLMVQGRGSSAAVLDDAIEYLRTRGWRVFPSYVAGMAPLSLVVMLMIDAITAQQRSALPWLAMALIVSTLWRWLWLARVQQVVQQDIQARPGPPLRKRLPAIMLVRLYNSLVLTWGSFLVLPPLPAIFVGGFATPMLLERPGPPLAECWRVLGLIHRAWGRLSRMLVAVAVVGFIAILAVFAAQMTLVYYLLPLLLNMDTSSTAITTGGMNWLLSLFYFVLAGFDLFWTVASVFIFYDCQLRRSGSDLRARLGLMEARHP